MTISGPGYFTIDVTDKSVEQIQFNLNKVEGYEYYFAFSKLTYEQINGVLISSPVTKVTELKKVFSFKSRYKSSTLQMGVFLVPTECTSVEFLINPSANEDYFFNTGMTKEKYYCMNIMTNTKFSADLGTNAYNKLYYYTNGNVSNIQEVDSSGVSVPNVRLLSLKVAYMAQEGSSNVKITSAETKGLNPSDFVADSAKAKLIASTSVFVHDMMIFYDGLDPRLKYGSNSITVGQNEQAYVIKAGTVIVFTKFDGIEGNVGASNYGAPIGGSTAAVHVLSQALLEIKATSTREVHMVIFNIMTYTFNQGVVITGTKKVGIGPVKESSATYFVFAAVYDGEASFKSDKFEYVALPDGNATEKSQVKRSFYQAFSKQNSGDSTSTIETKMRDSTDESYIIDGVESNYVFRYVSNSYSGDYRGYSSITKEKLSSSKVGIIVGIIVAVIIVVIIIVVIMVCMKKHKHHKSSSSSSSRSSKKKKKLNNYNADFAQPAGVYPNQGYPNQSYPPNPPPQPYQQAYQQQQAPIYAAPLDPSNPYQ
ncbi:hypothetical protein TVAG_249060 [Trichomonas vaginalis G3]|uniref:Uncharacterized protein n=2 Tax=Trichomonas vaginalis (strain ATCC PRA-98 / G3) TaxID=412133 RepID=A2DCA9_TRIV3|nr:hypothetical protein TVAG_249060 [Trichomonas vaginalis G3]|eukprot:XP_001582832.1 hypothetical protein [Trichomonas vaginalis G3]